jgi:hypothetical protein
MVEDGNVRIVGKYCLWLSVEPHNTFRGLRAVQNTGAVASVCAAFAEYFRSGQSATMQL